MRQIFKNKRQHHHRKGLVVLVHGPLRGKPHVDHTQLDLLELFGRRTQGVGRVDRHLDLALGACLDTLRKLKCGLVGRVARFGVVGKFQGHLCRHARCKSKAGGKCQASNEQSVEFHVVSWWFLGFKRSACSLIAADHVGALGGPLLFSSGEAFQGLKKGAGTINRVSCDTR